MAIIDCVSFNGEYDLFELRYQILKDYVDEFIVVEFDKTFSGKDKPCYIKESENYFYDPIDKWDKVKVCLIEEDQWSKYLEMAENSPNTVGAEHWKREFAQKESIKDCLTHLNDEDTVFIGDCDEIWYPGTYIPFHPQKLKLKVYTYWLNNRSNERFWGTLLAKYKDIKNECLNHLRTDSVKQDVYTGWHFTSLKGNLRQKLLDSYTEESYATPQVIESLEENIKNNKDFLGRDFKYRLDTSEWPTYLKQHEDKYKHLMKGK